ncbi:MAG: response regulator transcription factor [Lentimicrobiaceae bacterium]|jgi:DNA-binding NarL/FixJ family response regulator
MKKPDIIIVDDHLIFRQGLKSLLTNENIANVIGEASDGNEFIALLLHLKPDLVLLDIDMPHMNGIESAQKALELMPDLKIIIFTMFRDEEYYYEMSNLGVMGFILKSSGISELERAIQEVMMGECYFSNELLRRVIKNLSSKNTRKKPGIEDLTAREKEVLQNICLGLNDKEIAEKLYISPKTVKSHRSNLLEKTGCRNTPGLILFAIKNKMVNIKLLADG